MSSHLRSLVDWLDDRTGVRSLLHEALYERVPGGARWRYVWGSTLVIAFVAQMITGTFLWMAYSPSTQTAWESVFYIQYEMPGGWLLRGLHHYMAHAMVVLLAIHFAQVVWDGAYRAPRELNFVIGVALMLVVFGLSLTGYLLPWDQKGYWATSVGTNLASQAPIVGPEVKKLAIGGVDYGHHTLTRFLALHAGVLPGLLIALLVPHIALFRRHGLHATEPLKGPDAMFWPDQLLKDSVAALGVLAAVLALTIYSGEAELTAPADPATPYNAARPEWYFLFLFQFLKWFPGELEVWGAFVIPGAVVTLLFLMPWIGRSRGGHLFNVGLLVVLLGGIILLTAQAIRDDYFATWYERTEANSDKYDASQAFLDAKQEAEHEAERVIALAQSPEKIPPTGALTLMAEDPFLQGPKLFTQHCAGCHTHEVDGRHKFDIEFDPKEFSRTAQNFGLNLVEIISPKPTAPNLWGVGDKLWMQSFMSPQLITDRNHFGYENSPFAQGEMVSFIQEAHGEELSEEERKAVDEAFASISIALWLDAGTTRLVHPDGLKELEEQATRGRELIAGGLAEVLESGMSCIDCHKYHDEGELGSAPDLTGYMSREWMIEFIRNPASERFYGEYNDRMPAFAPHDDPRMNQLDDKAIGLIVDWLRGDWVMPETVEAPLSD
ncbi:cytochrome b [Bythopirellula goksoeyrii]|uniref:Menaquinol-cytochrome c reductase cytochrome b subunit n=1 Tax=Bythopirellula goksoeyrii TaxID=1400387 RepID=A0A5B9Q649_9BACT|nr:cytochrome bc complex cytochrome b subunit [Bythopirellula goksoeyrii]QEG33150.1 Menaquinol-cytochrome c reductase cytochrome b subunit [Bythopirellula goksoeyrii]